MPPVFETLMCACDPRMRSCSDCCSPVMTARAMMTAITPTVTPMVETSEMTEMKACFRFASR